MASGAAITEGNLPPVQQPAKDPELAAMRQDLNRLLTMQQRNVPAQPRQAPPQGQLLSKKDLEKQFYDNPLENVMQIASHIANNAVMQSRVAEGNANFETLIEVAANQARTGQEKLFDRFKEEIAAVVFNGTQDNPLLRQNVGVWRNALLQVKGFHADELIAEAGQAPRGEGNQSPALHLSGDGPAPPSSRQAPGPASIKITPEQAKVAKGLRITNEQYLEGQKFYDNQNEDPNEKSSWDQFVTFDTKEQRRKQRERAAAAARK